ncbi:uncharacterized protein si:dkey-192k22.2 isoform X1 [Rhinichthys klamathensis goyatoka]|uniref:uncharacterized protein si:dkey-192k22.2 isoform X1 n=2 Tax=Rhinichthys klamathensis goyatoka TaxID=3034132 RepID=UPI0024B5CD76|nr:uncharacterized protein si:dkey-192k22.2 isoform X1 [Rhinichthys klamathensis goyatoka]
MAQSSPSFTMTRSGAFKLSIVFFLTFILCLPEFFPKVSQIQFCCEPFDPCRPENDAKFCGQADPPCATELINASSQQRRDEGWYLCKAEFDLRLLHNNTSQSVEDVMVLLTMKAGNLTGWNISVFAFLNNTELYTGPQNDQRLFYCYLPPDNSQCPDLKMSTEEPTQQNTSHPRQNTSILKTTSSAKPIISSLKTTTSSQVTASTHELKCQTTSSSFLFYYQEHNETARSAALPVTQTKKEGWGVITSVWLALVLTVVVVTLLSVGCLIFKSKHRKSQLFTIVPISASGHQLSKPTENLMSNVPDVSIGMYSMSDDDVFFEISSTENRTEENLLRLADLMYKKRLSPIFEITDENEEEEQCNAPETKEEFKKSDQLQHLAAQGNCEPSTYLHHRNNFSCSGH